MTSNSPEKSKRNLATLALAVLLALPAPGCLNSSIFLLEEEPEVSTRSPAIVNGTVDNGHKSAVVVHSGNQAACTGTLIGKRTVLTAAHCVTTQNPPYQILSPVNIYPDWYSTTKYPAYKVTVHGSYAGGNHADIAVVTLSQDLPNITPAVIASKAPVKGQAVVMVGFGKTGENDGSFGTKRMASNTIASLDAQTITMKGATGSVGNTCNGDSGGPTFATESGQEVQIGVHSTKINYCGYAGTDMRMDAFRTWIIQAAMGDVYNPATNDTQPPEVSVTSPGSYAQVGPSFQVRVSATDNIKVTKVAIFRNAQKVTEGSTQPFSFQLTSVPAGTHTVEAVAYDEAGNSTSAAVSVVVTSGTAAGKPLGATCSTDAECGSSLCTGSAGQRYCSRACTTTPQCPDGFECSQQVCLKKGAPPQGSGTRLGYGAACSRHTDCLSNLCAVDGATGRQFCTKICDISAPTGACPQADVCQVAGQTTVCGPLHSDATGGEELEFSSAGCSVSGGSDLAAAPASPAFWPVLLLGSLLLLGRRHRARSLR